MLTIKNLSVAVDGKSIIQNLSLHIRLGELHVIMGPNGSGKSTLAHTLAGHPRYKITEGSISIEGSDVTQLKADKRAHKGLFLAFQYPQEIPGVQVTSFLHTALNSIRKARGQSAVPLIAFRKLLREKLASFSLDPTFLIRGMNEGFSGGEKKKMEMLQMALLEAKICILDETDSGLDVDALKTVGQEVHKLATKDRSMLIITHYQRILHYVKPDYVHVMIDGRIAKSGDSELGKHLEREGYREFITTAA